MRSDTGHMATQIARFPKENGSRARTVVVTQGKDPTVIAFNGGKVREARRTPAITRASSVCSAWRALLSTPRWQGAALSVTALRRILLVPPARHCSECQQEDSQPAAPVRSAGGRAVRARRCSSSR